MLDPFHWEFAGDWSDYGEGRQVAEILERSREYAGRVELLEDEAAGLAAFRSWDQFDAVHVASHGYSFGCDPSGWCRGGIVTGERLDVQELDAEARAALKASLKEAGIAIAVSGKGKKKTGAKDATPGAGDQAAGNAGLPPELLNATATTSPRCSKAFRATACPTRSPSSRRSLA